MNGGLIVALVVAVLATPGLVGAQPAGRTPRIGVLVHAPSPALRPPGAPPSVATLAFLQVIWDTWKDGLRRAATHVDKILRARSRAASPSSNP